MRIVFCLPGNTYSGTFLQCFTDVWTWCLQNGIQPVLSQSYSSMVNFARCQVAGADVNRGLKQKPFNGQHYDYMMWIDSDQIFKVENFTKLLSMQSDVASGWYSQPHGYTPVVEKLNEDYFAENGHYQFIKEDEMQARKFAFKADYIGFGWVLVKQGVFEQMEYPWFAPKKLKVPQGYEMCSEDVAWCLDAKALGIDIYVDPQIHVGHEKIQII